LTWSPANRQALCDGSTQTPYGGHAATPHDDELHPRDNFYFAQRGSPLTPSATAASHTPGASAESSLGDAESSLSDAESSLGDAQSSLGDAKSSLGDAQSSLSVAESSLGDAKSSLGDAESSLSVAESSLGDAESSLSDARSSLRERRERCVHRPAPSLRVDESGAITLQVNSRTHVPQKLTGLISLCTNPASISSLPIATVP
jgi:hypothetical protein